MQILLVMDLIYKFNDNILKHSLSKKPWRLICRKCLFNNKNVTWIASFVKVKLSYGCDLLNPNQLPTNIWFSYCSPTLVYIKCLHWGRRLTLSMSIGSAWMSRTINRSRVLKPGVSSPLSWNRDLESLLFSVKDWTHREPHHLD